MSSSNKVQVYKLGKTYDEATRIVPDKNIEPDCGQLRVRNYFAGVNGLFDRMVMQGAVGYMSLSPPFDLGVEAVGVVEAAGEGTEFSIGDAVATTGLGGAYRDRQIVAAKNVYKVHSACPEYLAIVPTGISALVALEQVAELKATDTIAITAAAGGLGHILVQLAANMGCRVIGIAGSDEKCAFVESLGAERCLNYKKENVSDVLKSDYANALDVAIDTVGGTLFDALLENIAPLGRLVVSGYASEIVNGAQSVPHPRVYEKLYWKGASVRGFMNALLSKYHRDAAERLFLMMDSGAIKVKMDSKSFHGLSALPAAADHMMSGMNIGKTFLDLR